MVTLDNLTVRAGGRKILDGVSFSLRPNRLTALVGRNGSGKSTLLRCVNRQVPYKGKVYLDGVNAASLSPRQRARQVAILPQHLPAPHITAREMAAFGRNPYLDITGKLTDTDRKAVAAALDTAEAAPLADRFVDTLSGGERQRIALAMILAQEAEVLLLDEPTAHMDLGYEGAFLRKLSALTAQKTVLVVLHDLAQAVKYAEDLAVLEEGRLVFAGTREECLRQEVLERVFGLRRLDAEGEIFFTGK